MLEGGCFRIGNCYASLIFQEEMRIFLKPALDRPSVFKNTLDRPVLI